MRYGGKTALVTGGGAGIGRATAIAFGREGAWVVVLDRDQAGAEETARRITKAGGEALVIIGDVGRSEDVRHCVERAVEAFGGIDCFFNNAGIEGRIAFTADYDEDVFDDVIRVNLRGVFLGLKHVIPAMLKSGGGAIVNTSSIAGIAGSPGMAAYVAAKHGVIGLTRTAAVEYGGRGVRVNAICPGPVETRMMESLEGQLGAVGTDAAARFRNNIPIGRYATADEVADLVLFLCADTAGSVNGAHFVIDGGRTAASAPPPRPGS